ncbi:MAG: leucine-rich repeat domain-containing protein [Clostridia bacterium]|nr:leucine-rich repeat domain-containing protein [Clostridia bacterium]
MKANVKKILAFAMCAALLLGLLQVSSVSAETVASGACGDNLTWTLDSEGLLTISGTGDMYRGDDIEEHNSWMYATSVLIEDGVTSIGDSAFYQNALLSSRLTSITIPGSVKYIGAYPWGPLNTIDLYYTGTLSEWVEIEWKGPRQSPRRVFFNDSDFLADGVFYIPEGILKIGDCAFWGIQDLKGVSIPDSVTSIGDYAFYDCGSLMSINVPGSVESIGMRAFSECGELVDVNIAAGVTSIGDYAFGACGSLISITIPGSVKSIGRDALDTHGMDIHYKGTLSEWMEIDWVNGRSPHHNVIIENDLFTGIVEIPEGTTKIDDYAFCGIQNLLGVTIPDSITSIGDYAFFGCSGLSNINYLPDSISSIGYCAFSGAGITSINIPDNVDFIDKYTFSCCKELSEVKFGSGVTSIPEQAFYGCRSLKKVELPEGITSIGASAFEGCKGITSVTIPASLTYVGGDAFYGCTRLKDVYYAGSEDDWAEIDMQKYNYELIYANVRFNGETDDPIEEPTTEEPSTEPVSEPGSEPVTDPVTEPTTETPATEPTATEPATEQKEIASILTILANLIRAIAYFLSVITRI